MKKTFALLLALVMALALVACGQKEDNIGGETKDDQTQTDGQSVDLRAEYEAAEAAQEAKPDVRWYRFQADQISAVFPTQTGGTP